MMIRMIVVALATFLIGCGGPVPIHLHTQGEITPEDEALVDEAVNEVLGLDWEHSDRARGAIHLTLHDGEEGTSYHWGRCHAHAVSGRHSRTIAHELAHSLGLEHSCEGDECTDDDLAFLMNGAAGLGAGTELTEEEIEELEEGRRRWAGC